MYLQQNKLNTKIRNRMMQSMSFFLFINFTFVTRKRENKNAPIEL